MSKITLVTAQIRAKLLELFPLDDKYTRIPNPYSLPDNNKNFLKKGYGLIIGGASYEEFEFCNFKVARTFSVVFTREFHRLDSSTKQIDEATDELLENVVAVQELFYSYSELGIEAAIAKVDLGSVSPVETFLTDKQNFLSMTVDFEFHILEQIN